MFNSIYTGNLLFKFWRVLVSITFI